MKGRVPAHPLCFIFWNSSHGIYFYIAFKQTLHYYLLFSEAPQITVAHDRLLVNSGETAILQCQAFGIPTPTLRWFKGDTEASY